MIAAVRMALTVSLCIGAAHSALAQAKAPADPSSAVVTVVGDAQIQTALDQLDAQAKATLARSGIPGLAVSVSWKGKTVFAKGYGVRKAGEAAAVDADTVFQLASVSKPLGASVLAGLVGDGVIGWDTPVVKHLPWFALSDAWVTRHLTIADLYAHRSGLPDHAGDELEDLGHDQRTILERLRYLPLAPFRSSYAYTNFGLTAAALAAAAASGKDWASLSQDRLYGPAGMDATSSRFADYIARSNRVLGHVMTPEGYKPLHVRQPDAQSPAGGASSSANDMAKWMSLVLGNGTLDGKPLIAAAALLPAISPHIVSGPPRSSTGRAGFYGYGFGTGIQASGRTSLSHSGAFLLGAGTNFLLIPSLEIGITVLTNAAPTGAGEALAMGFVDLIEYGAVQQDWASLYGGAMKGLNAPVGALVGVPKPASPKPQRAAAAYLGTYQNAYFGTAEVTQENGKLVLSLSPQARRYMLEHRDGDRFQFAVAGENAPPGSLSAVDFAIDQGPPAVTIEVLNDDEMGRFHKIAAAP